MSKRFWGVLAVIAIVLVGIIWLNGNNNTTPTNVQPTSHIKGSTSTGVSLVEYGDYQCIYCTQYYPIVKQVVSEYSSKITYQFRNLPLTSLHPNAFAAARAAEAAGLQGKFWQMHDLLYDQGALYYNQGASTWDTASNPESLFDTYATQLGLNLTQFKQDYSSEKVNDMINADVSAFGKTGAAEATPAFFLDGKQIQPNETASAFEQLINAAIAQKAKK